MSKLGFFKKNKSERKYIFRKKFFPSSITNKIYFDYLVSKGISIGKGTFFFDPQHTLIDVQRPWMISIGEYCKITSGVTILTHDYSRSVLRRRFSDILCECKETFIGNNVFLGINSIILMGTHIGNNCIVGAGSVVSGSFPDDVVIAGNPAKIICTIEDFYKKRKVCQIEEAKLWVKKFYAKYNRIPKQSEMSAFFVLFAKRDLEELKKENIWYSWNGDSSDEILESFLRSEPYYKCYEDFIDDALKNS